MGFFDLNIPYHEFDRQATDKSTLKGRRLKLALKSMELGYTGIAYNRTLKGVMSDSDRCFIPLFPLFKLIPSTSAFFASVKLHRELLNVDVSSPFRQYTRLTVIVDIPSQASALNAGNPILKSYDIVAVRPMNQNAFDQACQTSEVDMIAIDFSEKLPFRLKQPMVKAAVKRGVYFEVTYSGLIADAQSRRQMISNCKLLVDWTRGKNLILCSAAPSATELRGPQDVANLCCLLGLSRERARAAISKNCRSLLANALRKKQFYKEAVKVEEIPSGGQINSALSSFDNWLKWDPISSGEGDLLLEDMEKSFAISKTVKENMKAFNFTSTMNGLPAHGLLIKDLISVSKEALEQPATNNCSLTAVEIGKDATVENPVEQGSLNTLHEEPSSVPENQCCLSNLSKDQGGFIVLPDGQTSSSSARIIHLASDSQDSEVPLNYVCKQLLAVPYLTEHGQSSKDDAKIGHQNSNLEDSAPPYLPTFNGKLANSQDCAPLSNEKLNYSNGTEVNHSDNLERNLVKSEIRLQDIPSPVHGGNSLDDGGQVLVAQLESTVENHFDIDVSSHDAIKVDKFAINIDNENIQGQPLATYGASYQDVFVEGRQCSKMNDGSVKLRDGLPIEGSLNLTTDFSEPIKDDVMGEWRQIDPVTRCQSFGKSQAGRDRRKRNSHHQTFLFPFKHFLRPRTFKRKSRK